MGGLNGEDSETTNAMDSSAPSDAPFTAPPYWQNMPSRRRAASTQSSDSGRPSGAILLLDNEADEEEEDRNNACWAKSVEIVGHTIVNGGATSIGAFVVWNVRVETLQVRTAEACAAPSRTLIAVEKKKKSLDTDNNDVGKLHVYSEALFRV